MTARTTRAETDAPEPPERPPPRTVEENTQALFGPPVPGVFRAIANVMRAVQPVPKSGTADRAQGGYKFRSIDDVMDTLHDALPAAGLVIIPSMVEWCEMPYINGRGEEQPWWRRVRVVMRYTFIATADGSTFECEFTAVGDDNSDKGTGKAASYAYKLMASEVFALQFGDPRIDNEHADNFRARAEDEERIVVRRHDVVRANRPIREQPETRPEPWTAERWASEAKLRGVGLAAINERLIAKFGESAPVLMSAAQLAEEPEEHRRFIGQWLLTHPQIPEGDPFAAEDQRRAEVAALRKVEVEQEVAAAKAARAALETDDEGGAPHEKSQPRTRRATSEHSHPADR